LPATLTMAIALLLSPLASADTARTAAAAAPAPLVDPHGLDYDDIHVGLPEFDEPFQRDGVLVAPARILQVAPGVGADQVRALLGEPLRTGSGQRGPEWDYNLKLDLADEDFIVCQYKVVFDAEDGAVVETFWRRYQCRDAIAAAMMQAGN